ncbi:MAG: O-antigen ligase family protein [Rhodopirellula sp. JB055]|uniref:O-antigen ligase family protein n=1 Tax=Rhodopirellula sp. JB055 TaxID=3342846 RepID=UPI00370A0CA4
MAAAGQVNQKRKAAARKSDSVPRVVDRDALTESSGTSSELPGRLPLASVGANGVTPVVLAAFASLMLWAFYHPSDSTDVEQGGALGWCLSALLITATALWLRVGWSVLFPQRERGSEDRAERNRQWLVDAIVCLLAGWIGISTLAQLNGASDSLDGVWAIGGNWRAASNEAWVWIAGAVWFVVLRRCLRGGAQRFALLGLIVVGGVMLATHALHQVHVSLPQTLREYNADPDRVLAEVGINAPAGSNARMIFENRLRDGGPTATFALANTLAGLLAMSLVVVIAVLLPVLGEAFPKWGSRLRVGWDHAGEQSEHLRAETTQAGQTPGQSVFVLVGLLLIAAVLGLALMETQSRAGVLSVLIVSSCMVMDFAWATSRGRRWMTACSFAIAAVFVALPLAARGWFGTGWIASLPESVRYRFQYWEATWRMVEFSPWTGAGPGNYQQAYHRFRSPESHEIIADPHHFVCETLGAGGFPAGILLVALMLAGAWLFWRTQIATNETPSEALMASGSCSVVFLKVSV